MIPNIEFLLNIMTHMRTGFSPLELHFGKDPRDQILDILNFSFEGYENCFREGADK